jgi:enediyne biosynthesis protein E4
MTRWLSISAAVAVLFSVRAFTQQTYPATIDHPAPAWFVDVASKAGITVRNDNGSIEAKHYIIETTGSGVGIFGYDRGGWPDLPRQRNHAPRGEERRGRTEAHQSHRWVN